VSGAVAGRGDATHEITILGAGIVGCCCALALLERGYRVRIIDRVAPGEGTTRGSAGVISPWSCVPQAIPGVWRGVPQWLLDPEGPVRVRWRDLPSVLPWTLAFFANARPARLAKVSDAMSALIRECLVDYRGWLEGSDVLRDSLYLNVYRGQERVDENAWPWRLRRERGATVDYVNAAELARLEPLLAGRCTGAMVVRGQARAASPGALCRALADRARAQGATFEQRIVKAILPNGEGGATLVSDEGEHRTAVLVVAAGFGAAKALEPFGLRLPLIAERGYHVEYDEPGVSLNHSVLDVAGKYVVSSMPNGLRVAGTAEFADADAPADPRRARALATAAERLLPELAGRTPQDWMGVRPSFPDNLPAIGTLIGHRHVHVAFGHSHYGLSMAPGTARMIAALVSGESTPIDATPFDPGRFARGGG